MIAIKKLREEPYGLFLDYEGCPAGVAVNLETGNVYISDAPWHPASKGGLVGMIERADIISFQSQPSTSGAVQLELHCRFGTNPQDSVFQLGETTETAQAQQWLQDANDIIVTRDQSGPNNLGPLTNKVREMMLHPEEDQLLQARNFGETTLKQVKEALEKLKDSAKTNTPPSGMASGH